MYKNLENILNKNYEYTENPEVERSKEFAKAYKKIVERQIQLYGYELVNFSEGYCECSGFITNGQNFIYFSSGDYRWSDIYNDILIRTAKGPTDYRGGYNQHCTLNTLGHKANEMFEKDFNR